MTPLCHQNARTTPLLRFDLIAGRSDAELRALLDAVHAAVVTACSVPQRDRYQIVHEHAPRRLIAEDTGLGIPRSDRFVLLQMTTRPRSVAEKQVFYRLLCDGLLAACQIQSSDVMVCIVENGDADWSFGRGEAQFLTEH